MPTQLIAGDNQNEASIVGSNDGAIKFRIGPAGAKADGLSISSSGAVDVLGPLTQQGGAPVPRMLLIPAKATTSGTFIDFSSSDGTGIPSWAKKITVTLQKVSTNGVSPLQLQFNSEVTGYEGACSGGNTGIATSAAASGVLVTYACAAAQFVSGNVTIAVAGLNIISSTAAGQSPTAVFFSGGVSKVISSSLNSIRLTTVNGTDTFDAGSVSILVEGYE